jgi:hypothetical protein
MKVQRMASRREFLAAAAAAPLTAAGPHTVLDHYWMPILDGYLRNARATSESFAVCDFPGGTILKGATGKSGKTYDSVTRMLPALAAWVASGRARPDLLDTLCLTFQNAFDPAHPDYWLPAAPRGHSDQRQVESSIVAWSLWVVRDQVLPRLTPAARANIQAWLASCTRQPVRNNNWAWFTAVNQAVRLDLAAKWKEFSGDAAWMLDDLKFLDTLAAPGEGWYSDSVKEPIYDYYNFWVFASHFLYWNKIAGSQYPEWSEKFGRRLRTFLERTPYFFGANGSHVLYGRSLIYRWAVLTPLVLAYEQNLWPHPPGLLRAIVRRNLDFHWSIGAFDEKLGKLRETYSTWGNREICDSYIDNGHPYWGMQAFAFYLIPARDRFWTAREEPLPVERADFRLRFDALKMLLAGDHSSGQVRWLQARTFRGGSDYRDKYGKFSYSSHFPFNILKAKDQVSGDGMLIFRDPTTGALAARAGIERGDLIANGVEIAWWTVLGKRRIDVVSRIEIEGEFERRTHTVTVPAGPEIEAQEGSYPLGLGQGEEPERRSGSNWNALRSPRSGSLVMTWRSAGYDELRDAAAPGRNVISANSAVNLLQARLRLGQTVLASLHYASPKPLAEKELLRHAEQRAASK